MAAPGTYDSAFPEKYGQPRPPRTEPPGVAVAQARLDHLRESSTPGAPFDLTIIYANDTNELAHKDIVSAHSTVLADEISKLPASDNPCLDMKHVPPDILWQAIFFMYNTDSDIALGPRAADGANDVGIDRRPRIRFTADLYLFATRYRMELLRARALEQTFRDMILHAKYFPEDFPMLLEHAFGPPWNKEPTPLLKQTPQVIQALCRLPDEDRRNLWAILEPGMRRNWETLGFGPVANFPSEGFWGACLRLEEQGAFHVALLEQLTRFG
ncbi:hypothetical protein IWZ01DRAFT_485837 [Phyllosticta capitalensis]